MEALRLVDAEGAIPEIGTDAGDAGEACFRGAEIDGVGEAGDAGQRAESISFLATFNAQGEEDSALPRSLDDVLSEFDCFHYCASTTGFGSTARTGSPADTWSLVTRGRTEPNFL